jgi:hypothetical protein
LVSPLLSFSSAGAASPLLGAGGRSLAPPAAGVQASLPMGGLLPGMEPHPPATSSPGGLPLLLPTASGSSSGGAGSSGAAGADGWDAGAAGALSGLHQLNARLRQHSSGLVPGPLGLGPAGGATGERAGGGDGAGAGDVQLPEGLMKDFLSSMSSGGGSWAAY